MRTLFRRMLSWLRWPSAVACALSAVLMLASMAWGAGLAVVADQRIFGVDLQGGGVSLTWEAFRGEPINPQIFYWGVGRVERPRELLAKWWTWEFFTNPRGGAPVTNLRFPTWCLVFLLAGLSWVGFRVRRRLTTPASACPCCRHLLAGAALCPECGTKIAGEVGADDATRVA